MTKEEGKLSASAYHQWRRDVVAVIEVCEQINPRFRKGGAFMKACGVP